ncbi:hypothetical protein HYU93_04025 [Candidatus Daviesbacteria bacterium]|nr:hypothetical protein [Candidatus Daviesbacteria bacterium]
MQISGILWGGECDAEKLQVECLALAAADQSLALPAQAVLELSRIMRVPVSSVPVFAGFGRWVLDPEASDELGDYAEALSGVQEWLIEKRQFEKLKAPRPNVSVNRGSRHVR